MDFHAELPEVCGLNPGGEKEICFCTSIAVILCYILLNIEFLCILLIITSSVQFHMAPMAASFVACAPRQSLPWDSFTQNEYFKTVIQSECTVSQGLGLFSQFLRSKLCTECYNSVL